ncbi:MAG: ribosome maturation factor RimM [Clostridia bacterium]|jgi:16S rRNA processing protein RimM
MDKLAIGRIGAAHGLDGRVKVITYSGESGHFRKLDTVELRDGERSMKAVVQSAAAHGELVLVKFEGYDSPEASRVLAGFEIWVPRSKAAPKRKDEYYFADLVGCVLHAEGKDLATVCAVCDGGGGELLEVAFPGRSSVLIPFRKEFIGTVDIEGKRIELIAPWIIE